MKKAIIIICILLTVIGLGGGGYYLYLQEQEKQEELTEIHSLLEKAKQVSVEEKISILKKLKQKELYTETNLRDEILKGIENGEGITDPEKVFRFLEGLPKDLQQEKQKAYISTVDAVFAVGGQISKAKHTIYKGYLEDLYLVGKLDFKQKIALLSNFYADKKTEKIEKLETELKTENPNNSELYSVLAGIQWKYAEKKDIFQPEILALYKKAIELEPTNAHFYSIASIFVSENMEEILAKSLAENKSLHYSDSVRKEIREKYGKTALNYAKKAIEIEPENALYHYELGKIYFREMWPGYRYLPSYALIPLSPNYYDTSGNLSNVITSAQKSVELDSDNEFYAQNLMNLAYYFNKDTYRNIAITIGKDFFEKHPDNYTVLNNYAVLITQKPTEENLQQALGVMEKAYEKESGIVHLQLRTVFRNYLQIATLAEEKEIVKKLLKEIDDIHYKGIRFRETYSYGDALVLIGEKELGNTLKAIEILQQSYYSHMSASQVLSYYNIYLTAKDLSLISPLYTDHPNYDSAKTADNILNTLKERMKVAIEKM